MRKARWFWPVVGNARFWTFNVADVGVTVGAILLAMVLWREGRGRESEA